MTDVADADRKISLSSAQQPSQQTSQKDVKETWNVTTANHVIHAYVKAECAPFHKYKKAMEASLCLEHFPTILSQPNFDSPQENDLRWRALMGSRRWMWSEFPPTTVWYCVDNFQLTLDRAQHIRVPWPELRPNQSVDVDDVILFTHDRKSFTCIEGNHRLARWKADGGKPTTARFYIGQTNDRCVWHDGAAKTLKEFLGTASVAKFEAVASAYDPFVDFNGRYVGFHFADHALPWQYSAVFGDLLKEIENDDKKKHEQKPLPLNEASDDDAASFDGDDCDRDITPTTAEGQRNLAKRRLRKLENLQVDGSVIQALPLVASLPDSGQRLLTWFDEMAYENRHGRAAWDYRAAQEAEFYNSKKTSVPEIAATAPTNAAAAAVAPSAAAEISASAASATAATGRNSSVTK